MTFPAASMLAEIERIVSFGIRRPGYEEGLKTEQYLLERFNEIGLRDTRLEPVPVNYWRPSITRLGICESTLDIPCRAVPYTGWTDAGGARTQGVYVGDGSAAEYDAADVAGKLVVADMHFGDFNASHLKAGSHFIHDPGDTIPDGPLHCANWLIPNFSAYYEAWKRGATGFIGLLGEMPIDGCELYVPYDGFLKKTPAAWVGREHAAAVRSAAANGEPLHLHQHRRGSHGGLSQRRRHPARPHRRIHSHHLPSRRTARLRRRGRLRLGRAARLGQGVRGVGRTA